MFLMPSRYEPCGLNQLYSLRYGTPPIVHRTGGLADTVHQFDDDAGTGNGVVFNHLDENGLAWALSRALELWGDGRGQSRARWRRLQKAGMRGHYSWKTRAAEYVHLYKQIAP
jgi:starch synthase